jgi:hypothetical protein
MQHLTVPCYPHGGTEPVEMATKNRCVMHFGFVSEGDPSGVHRRPSIQSDRIWRILAHFAIWTAFCEKLISTPIFWAYFPRKFFVIIMKKMLLGNDLGDFFPQAHPATLPPIASSFVRRKLIHIGS